MKNDEFETEIILTVRARITLRPGPAGVALAGIDIIDVTADMADLPAVEAKPGALALPH